MVLQPGTIIANNVVCSRKAFSLQEVFQIFKPLQETAGRQPALVKTLSINITRRLKYYDVWNVGYWSNIDISAIGTN
ncbi:MAG TPA: hypothetical protein DER33_05555, partial [Syntrophomonas sp.]|nr:hypothetical protein [Syntrophomonas sp.]